MNTRINPFGDLKDPPSFTTKPRKERAVPEEVIARIADSNTAYERIDRSAARNRGYSNELGSVPLPRLKGCWNAPRQRPFGSYATLQNIRL
ncbi:MAG: hypothetical protein JWO91_3532 [Acidobacteriaceae bacterium]|nr:hypothetical protein [Acidobacteriaceae bacterium]